MIMVPKGSSEPLRLAAVWPSADQAAVTEGVLAEKKTSRGWMRHSWMIRRPLFDKHFMVSQEPTLVFIHFPLLLMCFPIIFIIFWVLWINFLYLFALFSFFYVPSLMIYGFSWCCFQSVRKQLRQVHFLVPFLVPQHWHCTEVACASCLLWHIKMTGASKLPQGMIKRCVFLSRV